MKIKHLLLIIIQLLIMYSWYDVYSSTGYILVPGETTLYQFAVGLSFILEIGFGSVAAGLAIVFAFSFCIDSSSTENPIKRFLNKNIKDLF